MWFLKRSICRMAGTTIHDMQWVMPKTKEVAMDRINRDLLKQELMRDEGVRLESYQDSVGLWTIGVGHLLGPTRRMTTITRDEMWALLEHDIDIALDGTHLLATRWGNPEFSSARGRALVNMAFNLGVNRLAGFKKFLAAYKAGDWKTAAKEMMDSRWAQQVGPRADRLRDMILNG